MVSPAVNPSACWEFEGEILVLHHPTTISSRYQAMVHCGSIRQTASILSMSQECLRTGDKALVHFRFIKHPEYIKAGQRMVFREGRTKAVGNVLRLIPQAHPGAQASRSKPNKMQSKQNSNCVQQTQQIIPAQAAPSLPQTVQQLSPVGNPDSDSPFEVTADKRENMPQRSGRKGRGRRGGRGRSTANSNSSNTSSKQPLAEQNPVATARSNNKA